MLVSLVSYFKPISDFELRLLQDMEQAAHTPIVQATMQLLQPRLDCYTSPAKRTVLPQDLDSVLLT